MAQASSTCCFYIMFYLSYRIINFLRLKLWFVFICAFQRMLYIWAKYGSHGVCSVSTQELDFFQSIHLDFSCNNGLATGYNNGKWETLVKCLLYVQKLRVFADGIISWVFGWVSLRDCSEYIFSSSEEYFLVVEYGEICTSDKRQVDWARIHGPNLDSLLS